MNIFRLKNSNSTNHKFNQRALVLIPLVLVCFGLSSMAQAVSPPPDGGYTGANTAEGPSALFSLTTGSNNTALGSQALFSLTTAVHNTATGAQALYLNTGDSNTADGFQALVRNTTGSFNTATGWRALFKNTTGVVNTANGAYALYSNTTGFDNTAYGLGALSSNTTGMSNTAEGDFALDFNTTGSNNIALGFQAGEFVTTANNVICIGSTIGANVSNSCFIGNIWNQAGGSQAVYVNSDGKLGALVSSRRFKDEIKPMEKASEVIYGLKPVSFRYKPEIEPTRPIGFGLIAEDVEQISPDLVTRGGDGKVNSVRYDQVNAMLLNEFLKEHSTVQELKKQVAALTATVKQQAALIQKVSDKVEINKPSPQVVNNQ